MTLLQLSGIYLVMGIIWVRLHWESAYNPSLKGAAKEMGDLAYRVGVPLLVLMWPILFAVWLYDVAIIFGKAFVLLYKVRMSRHCFGERCAMDNCTCTCEECTVSR